MRSLAALALFGLLAGCRLTRPDQDNFTLRTGGSDVRPFVATLSRKLGTSVQVHKLNLPSSDPSQMFELQSNGVTVIIVPVPDDRCNPNAPMHSTYYTGEYRVDVVYETRSVAERRASKQQVAEAAKEVSQTLTTFHEC